jgi:hypothetical protein
MVVSAEVRQRVENRISTFTSYIDILEPFETLDHEGKERRRKFLDFVQQETLALLKNECPELGERQRKIMCDEQLFPLQE